MPCSLTFHNHMFLGLSIISAYTILLQEKVNILFFVIFRFYLHLLFCELYHFEVIFNLILNTSCVFGVLFSLWFKIKLKQVH